LTQYRFSKDYALAKDAADPLRHFRDQFIIPQHNGHPVRYCCGNSLGLQPKSVRDALNAELTQWASYGVEGHFKGDMPWMYYHKFLTPQIAGIVGALEHEVVVMNTLTVNLHLMMVSFYRPTAKRFKIIMEGGAFPSDQYAVESQLRWHGYDPDQAIVELVPREGEDILRTEDILSVLEKEGESTALVLIGGVNYYTGQFYEIEKITQKAHQYGAFAGFDLAHAVGNVPLHLHDWGCDFAVWCSYKYLNAGPGGPAGLFVHAKHGENSKLDRFAGWWGHDENERFQMRKGFKPMRGAEGWQLSNAQVLSFAAHKAGLDIYANAGMTSLREKSLQLTGYLEFILNEILKNNPARFRIITPKDPNQRGCQLSALTDSNGRELFEYLSANGVIADWREPNVIRFAPVPLYNTFEDQYEIGRLIQSYFGD
jgi:kynureninase